MARTKADGEPVIGALSPWFGSKRHMAPEIIQQLGDHSAYWEPFCGSLAVLLAKPATSSETVNDRHGELINLARVCKEEDLARRLWERLRRFVMHETLFVEAAERWKSRGYTPAPAQPDIDRAEEFMVCSWFGRNGVAGTTSYNQGFCVRYTANGGHAATRWRSVVESIPAWHERLLGVTILNRDGFDLLERIDDSASTAVYCDPPYVEKGASYVHDFAAADHARLAESLRRFRRARVVVSYYDHPLVDDLYSGWRKLDCTRTKSLANQGMRDSTGTVKAPEVLLVNGRVVGSREELF